MRPFPLALAALALLAGPAAANHDVHLLGIARVETHSYEWGSGGCTSPDYARGTFVEVYAWGPAGLGSAEAGLYNYCFSGGAVDGIGGSFREAALGAYAGAEAGFLGFWGADAAWYAYDYAGERGCSTTFQGWGGDVTSVGPHDAGCPLDEPPLLLPLLP